MTQYRLNITTREQHQVVIDTDWFEDIGDPDDIDIVAEYFDSMDEWRLQYLVGGDRTWVDTTDAEFDDIYPVEETNG